MSQDLFAAFVGTNEGSQSVFTASTTYRGDQRLNELVEDKLNLGEDDWGDFEAAENTLQPVERQSGAPGPASKHHYSLDDLGPSSSILSGVLHKNEKSQLANADHDTWDTFQTTQLAIPSASDRDSDVLFDVTDENDEDEFGFLKETENAKASVPKQAEVDLLGLDDGFIEPPIRQPKKAAHRAKTSDIKFGSLKKVSIDNTIPKLKDGTQDEDEGWDDFSAWDNDKTERSDPAKASLSSGELPGLSLLLPSAPKTMTDDAVPPTNIPPPAVLLSMFPSIFERVENELLKPAAAQSASVRQQIYSQSKTAQYLEEYVDILIVFARVIAGRKLRWKRDTILAQSMRIGSASAGRVSGMKVTSVDKSELKKEDGEVAEALAAWNAQAGRVRTAVHEARKVKSGLGLVPEIKNVMITKTIKEMDGGVPSVRPCALCGLKREERVAKVDIDVMDSFGEWWIDTTSMHRACRDFWAEYEFALRQR